MTKWKLRMVQYHVSVWRAGIQTQICLTPEQKLLTTMLPLLSVAHIPLSYLGQLAGYVETRQLPI